METTSNDPIRRRRSDRYRQNGPESNGKGPLAASDPQGGVTQHPPEQTLQGAFPAQTGASAPQPRQMTQPQQLTMWDMQARQTGQVPVQPVQQPVQQQPVQPARPMGYTQGQPLPPSYPPPGWQSRQMPPVQPQPPMQAQQVPPGWYAQGWQPPQQQQPQQPPQQAQQAPRTRNARKGPQMPLRRPAQSTRSETRQKAQKPRKAPSRPVQGHSQGSQPPQPSRKRGATRFVVLLAAAALLIAIGVVANRNHQVSVARQALAAEVHAYDDLFCQGVYVDGIHLGGMTQQEATDAVVAQATRKRDDWQVTMTFGDSAWTLNAEQLGIRVSLQQAMDSAWAQGHTGTDDERKAQMDALTVTPFVAYTSLPGADTSVADALLQEIAQAINCAPRDASVAAFNAALTDPFVFNEEQVGRTLDVETLRAQVYQMVSTMTSGTLSLEGCVSYVYPSVTVAQLRSTVVSERFTAETKISSTSTEERTANIRLAMELISGTVLHPGDVFSFNDTVGERTASRGFQTAIEYQNGEEVLGIGGGVCQASTTVYQAALQAGLEIVDRSPHGMQVGYSDYGMDATVYWSSGRKIDLKFRNNTDGDVYIKTSLVWKNKYWYTRCTIYGPALEDGVTYAFAIEKEILPAPIEEKVVQDKKGQYVTYVDEEPYVYQEAKNGLKVTSYQVKSIGGVEVERTFIDTDTYAAKQRIVYVGVTQR